MRTQRETDLEDEIELLRGQLLSSYARIDELEAEVKLWRDNEQNFPDALNRIAELEAALPVTHRIGLIAARQRRANSEVET